jgi:chromosome segregation ATPase
MSDETTRNIPNADGRSFEERVFVRFDSIDARLDSMDTHFATVENRLQTLEEQAERRAVETKPIWERALKEIVYMRRELTRRLDRIEAVTLETRAKMGDLEDRVEKLETEPAS